MEVGPFETEKHLVYVSAGTIGISQQWMGAWRIVNKAEPDKVVMTGSTDILPTCVAAMEAAKIQGIVDAQKVEHQAANTR